LIVRTCRKRRATVKLLINRYFQAGAALTDACFVGIAV
jgi:hypothetical protein